MTVRVRLFAAAREAGGAEDCTLDISTGTTVADVVDRLRQDKPELAALLERSAFAVNARFARPATQLQDGDELAVLPPVSGG